VDVHLDVQPLGVDARHSGLDVLDVGQQAFEFSGTSHYSLARRNFSSAAAFSHEFRTPFIGRPGMELLRLIALDEDDLKIISAQLQDAILRMDEMTFLPKECRFAAVLKRFDWVKAAAINGAPAADGQFYERREAALRFERVLGAQYRNLPLDNKSAVEMLLAAHFEPAEPPGGFINLIFAGGGGIRLHVECIEAELRDLGPVWRTRNKPDHSDGPGDPPAAS
jgi:hypothetical protein